MAGSYRLWPIRCAMPKIVFDDFKLVFRGDHIECTPGVHWGDRFFPAPSTRQGSLWLLGLGASVFSLQQGVWFCPGLHSSRIKGSTPVPPQGSSGVQRGPGPPLDPCCTPSCTPEPSIRGFQHSRTPRTHVPLCPLSRGPGGAGV